MVIKTDSFEMNESDGGKSASPCWHCGGTISPKNVGYNIYTQELLVDPVYHPSVIEGNRTAAPCQKYRWLCWRCAKVEGYLW